MFCSSVLLAGLDGLDVEYEVDWCVRQGTGSSVWLGWGVGANENWG